MITINKEYMVFSPKQKVSKTNKNFVEFNICDSQRQQDGTYKNEYYKVIIWGNYDIKDREKLTFSEFTAVSCYVNNKDGRTFFNKEITAKLKESPKEIEYDNSVLDDDDAPEEQVVIDEFPF